MKLTFFSKSVLIFVLFIHILATNSFAQEYTLTDDDVTVENGVIQSCSYNFEIKDIIIPEILDGQIIIGIKAVLWNEPGVFEGKGITTLHLPATIKTIGSKAFKNNDLTMINFSNCTQLKIIGFNAFHLNQIYAVDFSNCPQLKKIESEAFSDNNIHSINFSNCENLEIIEYAAFFWNHMPEIDFSECKNLKKIGYEAFFLNGNLTSINLNGCTSLLEIGWWAFSSTSLSNVDLSNCNSLVTIGLGAFDETQVSNIILPTPDYPGFEYWESTDGTIFFAGDTVSKVEGYYAKDVRTPVTFIVTNDGSPIDSAIIDFYNGPYTTNEYGMLALGNVLQGSYPYTVSAEGFVDVEGEVIVDIDSVSVTIEMSGVLVEEIANINLSVYPNPGNDQINFELPKDFTGGKVELYNNSGQLVIGNYIQGNFKSISTEKLPTGIYLYRIFNDDKMVYSGKWVKE